jgi:hypothetical protein
MNLTDMMPVGALKNKAALLRKCRPSPSNIQNSLLVGTDQSAQAKSKPEKQRLVRNSWQKQIMYLLLKHEANCYNAQRHPYFQARSRLRKPVYILYHLRVP